MRALIFIQNLKQTILEITMNPSNHIFYSDNDYNLIKNLKKFKKKRKNYKKRIKS